MAAGNATVAADDTNRPSPGLDSIPVVELSLLSQSELYSLSQSSDSFDLNRCNDVVIPKINRSVFNESAGSRKQTYSRLRLARPASSSTTTIIRRRTPHLRPSHTSTSNNINDPEQAENSQIIRVLKQLLKSDPNFQDVVSIEDENNNNFVVPELLGPENLPAKRKRGRPRKHENAIFLRPPAAKRSRNNTIKKAVVYDNERDREIVNDRGVTVNMATLAGLEDPYGPEIRRRTVGMSTEDELLGFLRGLNGQWGSRRKKRRVVDASEFGDVLPKGWKMSLCIKKKEGRVWLFCRRFISPSGRQFESCKEISTYLISVIGEENLDKPNHANINSCDDFTSKGASVNAADLVLQEDVKRDDPVHNPSSPSPAAAAALSTDHENQVTLHIEDAKEVHICHKTFSERNQFNGHIGSHEKSEIKKTEPSLAPNVESDCDPLLMTAVPNNVVENCEASSGDKLDSNYKIVSGTESSTDTLIHDLNIVSHGKQDEQTTGNGNILTEESCDKSSKNCIAVSQSELLGDEVSNGKAETSGEEHVNYVDNISDGNLERMGNANGVVKDETSMCASVEVLNQDAVSETGVMDNNCVHDKSEFILEQGSSGSRLISSLPNKPSGKDTVGTDASVEVLESSIREEKGSGLNMDMHINNTSDELISEKEKVVDCEPSHGFFLTRFGLDKDSATVVKNISTKENRPLISPSIKSVINSARQKSPQKEGFGLDGRFEVRSNAFDSYDASRMEGMSTFEEGNKFTSCSESSLLGDERNRHIETNVEKAPSKETKLDVFQIFKNNEPKHNESVGSLVSSHDGLNRGVMGFNTSKNLEFSSLVRSENEQSFDFQDDVTSDDIFENKIYSTALDGLKFDEDRDISSHELSLAFGNPHAPSKIEEAFDVHTNLSMVNNSMVEDLNQTSGFGNGANTVYPTRASDEFRNTGNKKFMTGFGSNHEDVARGTWKTGQGSQLLNDLANPSHAHIQSPSSFHSFDIMSQKAEDGPFRLDERYNDSFGVSGLRSGRPEPMEFSFLTGRPEHNPNAIQGDSRVFSYNPEMEQPFDSSFWLGKNAINQATGVCAWCRNEFHLQDVNSGTQDGVGSLCPACNAGISGHVNML